MLLYRVGCYNPIHEAVSTLREEGLISSQQYRSLRGSIIAGFQYEVENFVLKMAKWQLLHYEEDGCRHGELMFY